MSEEENMSRQKALGHDKAQKWIDELTRAIEKGLPPPQPPVSPLRFAEGDVLELTDAWKTLCLLPLTETAWCSGHKYTIRTSASAGSRPDANANG